MLVRFKQSWFGPGEHLRVASQTVVVVPGHLYERTADTSPAVELPEEYRAFLDPRIATVVGDDDVPMVSRETAPAVSLRDFDDARMMEAATDAVAEKAEANRLAGTRKPRIN